MSNDPRSPSAPPGPAPHGRPGVAGHPSTPLATWRERFTARLIDGTVFGASMIVSSILYLMFVPLVVISTDSVDVWPAISLVYLASWVVPGLLYGAYDYALHAGSGQTLGKMALRIRVVSLDGRPLSRQVLLRRSAAYPGVFVLIGVLAEVLWSAGALGTLLAVGLNLATGIPIIADQRLHRALHDRFAGTVVIRAA